MILTFTATITVDTDLSPSIETADDLYVQAGGLLSGTMCGVEINHVVDVTPAEEE